MLLPAAASALPTEMPLPSMAAVAPTGASTIIPTHRAEAIDPALELYAPKQNFSHVPNVSYTVPRSDNCRNYKSVLTFLISFILA